MLTLRISKDRSDSVTKEKTSLAYSNTLPEELIFLIFSHFAIEELAQSRAVCRLWRCLSDDPKLLKQVFRRALLKELDYKKINNLILFILNHKNECGFLWERLVLRSEFCRTRKDEERKWRPLDACISALAYIFFKQYGCRQGKGHLFGFSLALTQGWKLTYSFEVKTLAKGKNKNPYAQFIMGLSYAVDKQFKLANPLFKKSYEGGYAPAAYLMGCIPNERGKITFLRQLRYFKASARSGCLEAQKALSILVPPRQMSKFEDEAEQSELCLQNDIDMAQFFIKNGEVEEGLLYLIPHARKNNKEIQFILGELFEADVTLRDPWLLFAENQGENLVPFFMGRQFAKRETLDLEAKAEVQLYEMTLRADKNFLHKILAKLYTTGHVLTKNLAQAKRQELKAEEIDKNIEFNAVISKLEDEIERKDEIDFNKNTIID